MSEKNKAMVRTTFEEVYNRGNFAIVDERVSADYVGHSASEIRDPEDSKQFAAMMRSAFPDLEVTVEDQIAEGDTVVQRWTARGTHEGSFRDISPTGKQFAITGISIYRITSGKIVESWTNADMLGMMQQLGAVHTPELAS